MVKRLHSELFLGIDLGGTKILAAVADTRGKVLAQDYRLTPAELGPEAVVQAILEAAHRALERAGITPAQLRAVGIGAAGAANPDTGILHHSPHLPGLKDVPLTGIVERELGIKAFLGNDANTAALGELYFGAGRRSRDFIYITVSTGIGGGIIIDGKLYVGATGVAGEVGHMIIDINGPRCSCGNFGCWETLASGTALAREARHKVSEGATTSILEYAKGDIEQISAETVHAAAQHGDSVAQGLIAQIGYYFGVGLVNLLNIFNPELVLIGGGLANMGDLLLQPALKVVKERAFPEASSAVRFAFAKLGRDAGVIGAVALARQRVREIQLRR